MQGEVAVIGHLEEYLEVWSLETATRAHGAAVPR